MRLKGSPRHADAAAAALFILSITNGDDDVAQRRRECVAMGAAGMKTSRIVLGRRAGAVQSHLHAAGSSVLNCSDRAASSSR